MNAAALSVGNVAKSLIYQLIARLQRYGKRKIQQKAVMYSGLWQTLNLVPSVKFQLRKTKDVILCNVETASISFVGCVCMIGALITIISSATSMKRLKTIRNSSNNNKHKRMQQII